VWGVTAPRSPDINSLVVEHVDASYGVRKVLDDCTVAVEAAQVVGLFGHNGAGKTTLLRVVAGFKRCDRGSIDLLGKKIDRLSAAERASTGLGFVPDGAQGIFPTLTVDQHVRLGRAWRANSHGVAQSEPKPSIDELLFDLFPEVLKERRRQVAGSLSGGQRQMLALALALLREPRVLLLDEPSLGLAPRLVERLMDSIRRVVDQLGVSVLIVEQDVGATLPICDRVYLLKTGSIVADMAASECPPARELWTYF
jgi:ABC-type branched-subunit amino acid transport system ATPase component